MNIRIGRMLLGIGFIFCFFLLLVLAAAYYLKTDHAQQMIQGQINRAIPGHISWNRFEISYLNGTISFRDVIIKGQGDKDIVTTDRLYLHLNLPKLFRRQIAIENILLEKPDIALTVQEDGQLDLVKAFYTPGAGEVLPPEKTEGGFPFAIVLKSFKLKDGFVRYETQASHMSIKTGELNISGHYDVHKKMGGIIIWIVNSIIESSDLTTTLSDVKLMADYQQDQIQRLVLEAVTPASTLSVEGKIADLSYQPSLNLSASLKASLSEIGSVLKMEEGLSGAATVDVTVNGTIGNPTATLTASYGGGEILSRPIKGASVKIGLENRRLSIDQINLDAFSGNLNVKGNVDLAAAFPNGFLDSKKNFDEISYQLFLTEAKMSAGELLEGAKGTFDSTMQLAGKGISLEKSLADVSLTLSAKLLQPGTMDQYMDLDIDAASALSGGIVTLHKLGAVAGDAKLAATGFLNINEEVFNAELILAMPQLSLLMTSLGIQDISGGLHLKTIASGHLRQPVFDLDLRGNNLTVKGTQVGDVLITGDIDPKGKLTIPELRIKNGDAQITGKGEAQIFKQGFNPDPDLPLVFDLKFTNVEVSQFVDKKTATGNINADVKLNGTLNNLTATMDLHGRNLGFSPYNIGDVDAMARLMEGSLSIDELKLTNKTSAVTLAGDAKIFPAKGFQILDDPLFNLQVQSGGLFIEDFIETQSGKFILDVKAGGTLKHPAATIRLDGSDMDFSGQKIASLKMASDIKEKKINFSHFSVWVSPRESVEIGGWISLDKTFDLSLDSKGISLTRLNVIPESAIKEGTLLFNFKADGSIDDPKIEGGLHLSGLRLNGKILEDITLTLDVKNHLAKISGNPGFDLNGQYHLTDKTFSLSTLFNGTDLSPYFKFLDQPDFGGSVSGKIELSGKVDAEPSFRGNIHLSKLDLAFREKSILKGEDMNVSLKDDEISIPGLHLILGENGFTDIAGNIRVNGPVALKAHGNIPLSAVQGLHEDLYDVSGDLLMDLEIKGEMSYPEIRGKIDLEDISATVPYLSQQLNKTNGRIWIAPDSVNIENISGKLDTGQFDVKGQVNLDHYHPVDFKAELTAGVLPVNIPDTLNMVLDAKLKLRGTPESSIVNGDITLVEGTYYKDVKLNFLTGVMKKKRESTPPPPPDAPSVLDHMALNIALKHRNPFIVDNNLAMMNIIPDLKISGTGATPIINGRADITSGTVTYRKKEFIIKKGVVDFLNPYKIEPTLDISSEVTVRDWLITLGISGTTDEMTFKLSSDPPLDDGDILSLLLIGRTSKEMIAGEGGSNQSAQQMLAEALADVLDKDIKNVTGLDIFETQMTGTSENGNGSDVKVTLGKEISKRLTVKYVMETKKGEMVQGTIAEYKFLEDILVSGFQDNQGSFGSAIKYRLEFR